MSSFLVNLARRSAGLAPVVRARSALALAEGDPPPEPAAEVRSVPLAIGPVPAPVVQRAPVANAASAASPSSPPVARVADSPPPFPRRPTPVDPAPRERSIASVGALPEPQLPPVPRRIGASARAPEPTIAPAAVARIDPPEAPRREERERDVVRVDAQIIEHVIERVASDAPEPVVVRIQPAEPRLPSVTAPVLQPTPERMVHVHIGAIEIHGADADAGARPRAADASSESTTAAASPASTAGGFDDYAALRSYAPWAW